MNLQQPIARAGQILEEFRAPIGCDWEAYRNHVYRVAHFCLASGGWTNEDQQKIAVAAAFHDLGIWTDDTFDYLSPSIQLATDHLQRNGLDEWIPDISRMIALHHQLTRIPNGRLAEAFRRSDLVDVSLGLFRCGLSRSDITAVRSRFPNAGFHRRLIQLAARRFREHPFSPLPMVRW